MADDGYGGEANVRAHVCVSLFVMEMVGLPQGLPLSAILFPPLQGEAHARIYVPCAARTMLVILDIVSNFFSAFIIAFFFLCRLVLYTGTSE